MSVQKFLREKLGGPAKRTPRMIHFYSSVSVLLAIIRVTINPMMSPGR